MAHEAENYENRLGSLRTSIAEYAAEMGKLESEVEVTPSATSYFSHLFSQAVNLGMTETEIRKELAPLNTPFTRVADTNPNRGYRKWSTSEGKYVWISADRLCLALMSPLEYQHWVYDVGGNLGIKNARQTMPPPRPRPTPSAETDMIVTTSVCAQTGVRTTIYTPRGIA